MQTRDYHTRLAIDTALPICIKSSGSSRPCLRSDNRTVIMSASLDTNHQQMQQAVFYAPSHAGSFLLAAPSDKLAAPRRVVARGAAVCCMLYIDCPGSTVSISLLQPPPCLPSRCRTGCLRSLDLAQSCRVSLIWPGLRWRCSYMCSHAPHILSNDKTRFVVNSFGFV